MNQKEAEGKLLDAILTARAAAEEAGGLGLCLGGVLDIVEVSFINVFGDVAPLIPQLLAYPQTN
ncbi:MAG: hypothetical protein KKH04_10000 [Proteobacteria bacterium]|nr:hypothetical protein [Pseudomonadota bacterium]